MRLSLKRGRDNVPATHTPSQTPKHTDIDRDRFENQTPQNHPSGFEEAIAKRDQILMIFCELRAAGWSLRTAPAIMLYVIASDRIR